MDRFIFHTRIKIIIKLSSVFRAKILIALLRFFFRMLLHTTDLLPEMHCEFYLSYNQLVVLSV